MNDAGWLIEPFSLFESSIVVFPTTQARQLFHTWMSCEKLNKNLFCHMTMLWPQMKFESSFLGVSLVFTEPLSLINFIWFLSFCFVTSHRMCGLVPLLEMQTMETFSKKVKSNLLFVSDDVEQQSTLMDGFSRMRNWQTHFLIVMPFCDFLFAPENIQSFP